MPNKKEIFKKSISLVLGVMIISLALSFWVMAWTEPDQPPVDGNVAAPINVGDIGQTKTGWLATLGGLLVGFESALGDPPPAGVLQVLNGALINTNGAPTGLIVAEGKVGIGTSTVSDGFRMEVKGNIKLSDDPEIFGEQNFTITNVKDPVNPSDVATKAYVDSQDGGEACRMRLKFAGYTPAYNGNLGGPKGAHDKCASAFPGYNNDVNHVHWCSIDELDALGSSYTYQHNVWVRDAIVNLVWVPAYNQAHTFYKRYMASYDEDNGTCQAWLATAGGNVGPVLLTSGAMSVADCSNSHRLACCYFGE